MAKEWFVEKVIDGKKCKVRYYEWEYAGGSKIQVSSVEYLDEFNCSDTKVTGKN